MPPGGSRDAQASRAKRLEAQRSLTKLSSIMATLVSPSMASGSSNCSHFDSGSGAMQFMERAEWIPSFNIAYILGVDGLSLPMVVLTGLLCFLGIFVSWNINKAVKGYFALFLLLDTGIMGVFLSMDFFLFYIF